MKKIASLLAAVLIAAPVAALAAGAPAPRMERFHADSHDFESLQRGARLFVNYCLNCHTARFMRYNRLTDLGLSESQIADNLILTGRFEETPAGPVFAPTKIGETMQVAMRPADAKAWFGVPPPDLTVIARARGADWLYTYLRSFYRDAGRPSGWNNVVYPNVGMPHVLWELQGEQALKTETVPGPGYPVEVQKLVLVKPGKMTPVEYDRMVADLVNYLDYVAEPARNTRTTLGIYVLLFLGVFFVIAYALKKAYWKDVH